MRLVRGTAVLLAIPAVLAAQNPRDSLVAGRRSYERAELTDATRLLPFGLVGVNPRDSLWWSGAHMLLDALLENGDDSLAAVWGRWSLRRHPELPIDSNIFPPRVARVFIQARSIATAPLDSTAPARVTYEPLSSLAPRGQLRFLRGSNAELVVVEHTGTLLQGESRTLAPGTYTMMFGGTSGPRLSLEVLPGFVTSVMSRPAVPGAPRPAAPPSVSVHEVVASGASNTTCVIISAGNAACWGDNRSGQLGGGFADTTPGMVVGERELRAVAVGAAHACGLTSAGAAWCWGLGASGQLGGGPGATGPAPVAVAGNRVFVQVVAGGSHSCGLTPQGAAFCWGGNRAGELGNRSDNTSFVPVPVSMPGTTFTSLTAGSAHTCGLAANGTAWCWGANDNGQLGNGSNNRSDQPVQVQGGLVFRELKAGNAHTCGLSAPGQAFCWGANANGQLGNVLTESQSRPAAVSDGLVFSAIETGEVHSCGLTADGAAYCWGSGRSGQLGNGAFSDSPRPVLVVGGHTFSRLALGQSHSCGVTALRTVYCWGDNSLGQAAAMPGRPNATPAPTTLRPAPLSLAVGTLPRLLRETFADGDFTTGPAWLPDVSRGARSAISAGELAVSRSGSRGLVGFAGISTLLRAPVRRETAIEFDVRVDSAAPRGGCALNCAAWPAMVRVRVKNSDLTESEAWFAFGYTGGKGGTLGPVVIVAKGDATPGQWLRAQRFVIREALPRADTILQVSIGGIGTDFASRFDNISLPVGQPAAVSIRPDTARLASAGDTIRLVATVRDSLNAVLGWVPIVWSSSDTLVASVDTTGLVRARRNGRALIRATGGGIRASATIIVSPTRTPPSRRGRRP